MPGSRRRTSSVASAWRLQWGQSRRARRCATVITNVSATRYGCTPISDRRATAPQAVLVWIVEKSRCPVSDDRTAISAVAPSRISPSMMMSGSCRRKVRSAAVNVRPISSLSCTWLTPSSVYSIGSSIVRMLSVRAFSRRSVA